MSNTNSHFYWISSKPYCLVLAVLHIDLCNSEQQFSIPNFSRYDLTSNTEVLSFASVWKAVLDQIKKNLFLNIINSKISSDLHILIASNINRSWWWNRQYSSYILYSCYLWSYQCLFLPNYILSHWQTTKLDLKLDRWNETKRFQKGNQLSRNWGQKKQDAIWAVYKHIHTNKRKTQTRPPDLYMRVASSYLEQT